MYCLLQTTNRANSKRSEAHPRTHAPDQEVPALADREGQALGLDERRAGMAEPRNRLPEAEVDPHRVAQGREGNGRIQDAGHNGQNVGVGVSVVVVLIVVTRRPVPPRFLCFSMIGRWRKRGRSSSVGRLVSRPSLRN